MTNNLKRQVEVQGTKKLDSVKGVQTLEINEMKEIEGGIGPLVVLQAIKYGMLIALAIKEYNCKCE